MINKIYIEKIVTAPISTTLLSKPNSNNNNKKNNSLIRQRNIQIKAIDSVDKSDDEEAMEYLLNKEQRSSTSSLHGDDDETTTDNESADVQQFLDTHVIIKFANNVSMNTLHWIIDKIRAKKSHGGAELLIRREPNTE